MGTEFCYIYYVVESGKITVVSRFSFPLKGIYRLNVKHTCNCHWMALNYAVYLSTWHYTDLTDMSNMKQPFAVYFGILLFRSKNLQLIVKLILTPKRKSSIENGLWINLLIAYMLYPPSESLLALQQFGIICMYTTHKFDWLNIFCLAEIHIQIR